MGKRSSGSTTFSGKIREKSEESLLEHWSCFTRALIAKCGTAFKATKMIVSNISVISTSVFKVSYNEQINLDFSSIFEFESR